MTDLKTILVSPELNGDTKLTDMGTFSKHLIRLLQQEDTDLSLYFSGASADAEDEDLSWLTQYRQLGIPVETVIETKSRRTDIPLIYYDWFVRRATKLTEMLPDDTDIVYNFDTFGNTFHLLRTRQYGETYGPTVVTILNRSYDMYLEGMRRFPFNGFYEHSVDFVERYTVEHSDFIVSPSHSMIEWMKERQWKLPPDDRVFVIPPPFLPTAPPPNPPMRYAKQYRRIVFFGNTVTHEGFDIFSDTMMSLGKKQPELMRALDEVVVYGYEAKEENDYGNLLRDFLAWLRRGIDGKLITPKSEDEVLEYLRTHASDTLVVIPSLIDHAGYKAIQALHTEGLNILVSDQASLPERIGYPDLISEPFVLPLSRKIAAALKRGPSAAGYPQEAPYHA